MNEEKFTKNLKKLFNHPEMTETQSLQCDEISTMFKEFREKLISKITSDFHKDEVVKYLLITEQFSLDSILDPFL